MLPLSDSQKQILALKKRMEDWQRFAQIGHPAKSRDYIKMVCEEIVRRAQLIALTNPISSFKVAEFLLDRTNAWIMSGTPIEKIGGRLPKNLTELGVLKMQEGSDIRPGAALSKSELQAVVNHQKKKHKLIH